MTEKIDPELARYVPTKKRKPYDTTSRMRGARHPTDKIRMGNIISKQDYFAILHLAYNEHYSMREIMDKVGLSKNTVQRYYPRDAVCACGLLLVKHRTDCDHRRKKHPYRQLGRKRGLERGRETQRKNRKP